MNVHVMRILPSRSIVGAGDWAARLIGGMIGYMGIRVMLMSDVGQLMMVVGSGMTRTLNLVDHPCPTKLSATVEKIHA